jgi:hypothetical protein
MRRDDTNFSSTCARATISPDPPAASKHTRKKTTLKLSSTSPTTTAKHPSIPTSLSPTSQSPLSIHLSISRERYYLYIIESSDVDQPLPGPANFMRLSAYSAYPPSPGEAVGMQAAVTMNACRRRQPRRAEEGYKLSIPGLLRITATVLWVGRWVSK